MVNGIDANRQKWQELCMSYQENRRASTSSQSTDPGHNTESSDDGETSEFLKKTEKTSHVKNTKFGSKSESRELLSLRANKEVCN